MARPWEYERWRRVLMQALMWVILGGTLGLAQLLTYSRNHSPILLGPARQLGPLLVRLPDNWISLPGEGPEPDILQAQDEEGIRELVVSIEPPSSAIVPQILRDPPGDSEMPTPIGFKGLGLHGAEVIVSLPARTPDGRIEAADFLIASARLPSGNWVQIRFRESDSRIGSADRLLVEAVADGITRADRKLQRNEPGPATPDPNNFD